jgi:hypothetical protein
MSSFQSLDINKTQYRRVLSQNPLMCTCVTIAAVILRDVSDLVERMSGSLWGRRCFECLCGQKYLTGATEWDHLGDWERRRRLEQIFGLGILFSAFFLVPGLVVYFALHRSRTAFITAFCIAALPFSLMFVPFSLEVAASMWRTRTSGTGSERIR